MAEPVSITNIDKVNGPGFEDIADSIAECCSNRISQIQGLIDLSNQNAVPVANILAENNCELNQAVLTANAMAQQAAHRRDIHINKNSWEQRLLIPGIELMANLALLEFQKEQMNQVNETRLGLVQCATTEVLSRMNHMRQYLDLVFDDIPDAALYVPVSAAGEQLDTITDNANALKYTAEYAEMVSKYHVEHDLARQILLNPTYYQQIEVAWTSIEDLMAGRLPVDDVVEILSDTAEQALLTGKIGNSQKLTHRNLGVSTLRAQSLGRAEARLERQAQGFVSNPNRMGNVTAFEYGLQDRVSLALKQAQLIQNSLQNANNLCAKADPYLMAQLQMDMKKAEIALSNKLQQAGLYQSFVPNYAQVISSQISDMFDGLMQKQTTVQVQQEQPYAYARPIAEPRLSGLTSTDRASIK